MATKAWVHGTAACQNVPVLTRPEFINYLRLRAPATVNLSFFLEKADMDGRLTYPRTIRDIPAPLVSFLAATKEGPLTVLSAGVVICLMTLL